MMTQRQALEVLARHRRDQIVLTTMSSVALWPEFSDSPLDFHFIPSAMGHAVGLALGLVLAQPERGVIVVNGDGSLLMNLGCLVTLARQPANVYMLILDNGLYEVTGGQQTAGSGRVDFADMARAAGVPRVLTFASLEGWQTGAAEAVSGPGPVVSWLKVEGRLGEKTPKPPRPMHEQIGRLRQALGVGGMP